MAAPAILNGEAGSAVRTKLNNVLASVQGVAAGSNFSYRLGVNFATMDAAVEGSWAFDGTQSFPNKLGVDDAKPVTDPATGARAADANYVAGGADLSAILAGYDNVVNAQAAVLASQHSMIYTGADHGAIIGGSLLTISANAVYAMMFGGTSNTVGVDCDYGVVIGGDQNQLLAGASDTASGFRGAIIGATSSDVQARSGVILGGNGSHIAIGGTYATLLNAELSTISGSHSAAFGNSVTVSASYSFAGGDTVSVAGARSLAIGTNITIASGHDYSSAIGLGAVTPFAGAHVSASRQRGSTPGNNQSLQFQCSQETTDTTTTRLSLSGSASYPTQPPDSIVSGAIEVVGVSDAGVCSAFRLDFVSERIGTGTPTLRQNATAVKYDGLALPTDPTMNVTAGGIYRVQVVGLTATNIRWNAVAYCNQIVFT
jgi:hypothetical protein